MVLRTVIETEPFGFRIDYGTPGLAVGSCFASNIASRLRRLKFPVAENPFGVVYNPASVAAVIGRLSSGEPFTRRDLDSDGDLWFSYDHHGSFAATDPDMALERMNSALRSGREALEGASYVVLTLGTAWVYERGGKVVANCHRRPASEFAARRMDVDEVVDVLTPVAENIFKGRDVILTVSPVRHLKNGLADNSLGKAVLRVASGILAGRLPNVTYFPAYEIVNDDLRDYRFYEKDMLHPSEAAVDYIWDRFCGSAMTPQVRELAGRVGAVVDAASHRPFNPDSAAHRGFLSAMLAQARALAREHPEIDLSAELACFGA